MGKWAWKEEILLVEELQRRHVQGLASGSRCCLTPASAGSGAEIYGTTAQIANVAGVAPTGAAFWLSKLLFRRDWRHLRHWRVFAQSIAAACRILVLDAAAGMKSIKIDVTILGTDSTRSF